MKAETQRAKARQVVRAVSRAFPLPEYKNWPECRRLLPQALVAAQYIEQHRCEPDEAAADLLNSCGIFVADQGEFSVAEQLLTQAHDIRRAVLGENHLSFAASCTHLAGLYHTIGRLKEAEPLAKQAVEITRTTLGEEHHSFAMMCTNLAGVYQSMGRYDEAEQLMKQALAITRTALGSDHLSVATICQNLATLYYYTARISQAEQLYEETLRIKRRMLGEADPSLALTCNNLVGVYKSMRRYAEAEALMKQVLETTRRTFGEEHPAFATSCDNLAAVFHDAKLYEKAEPLAKRALEIRRKSIGEDHLDFATSCQNLASIYEHTGRSKEAEPLMCQAMEITRRVAGEEHASFAACCNNLARLYQSTGQYTEAERLHKLALAIRQRVFGQHNIFVAKSYDGLAEIYRRTGRQKEARRASKQARKIHQSTFVDDPYLRLDRKTHSEHLRTLFSPLTVPWFFRRFLRNLMLPIVRPVTLAGSSSAIIETTAYTWFVFVCVAAVAGASLTHILIGNMGLSAAICAGIFCIGIYPMVLAFEVVKEYHPHSMEHVVLAVTAAALICTIQGSTALAMMLSGWFVGHALAEDLWVEVEGRKLQASVRPYNLVLFLLLLVAGVVIGGHIVDHTLQLCYVAVLAVFLVAQLTVPFCFGATPDIRNNGIVACYVVFMLACALLSGCATRCFPLVDSGLFLVAAWTSFMGFAKGRVFFAFDELRHTYSTLAQLVDQIPLPIVARHLAILILIVSVVRLLGNDVVAIFGVVGSIVMLARPTWAYGIPSYLAGSAITSIGWVRTKMMTRQTIPRRLRDRLPCQFEGLQWSLPFFSDFVRESAKRYGRRSALDELERYSRTSMETTSVVQSLRVLLDDHGCTYDVLCWGVSRRRLFELTKLGLYVDTIRGGVQLLVATGFLERDPFEKERVLRIPGIRQDYEIVSIQGPDRKALLLNARNVLAQAPDAVQFSGIVRTVELASAATSVMDFCEVLLAFMGVECDRQLPHSQQLLQNRDKATEIILKYEDSGRKRRVVSSDRNMLLEILQWCRNTETVSPSLELAVFKYILTRLQHFM